MSPRSAKSLAVALPMPALAPVMTTVLVISAAPSLRPGPIGHDVVVRPAGHAMAGHALTQAPAAYTAAPRPVICDCVL